MRILLPLLIALSLLLFACGGEHSSEQSTEQPASAPTTLPSQNVNPADRPAEVTIELGSDDAMRFDKSELKVYAGQKVTLTLTHTGSMDKNAMGHNFVLLKPGTNLFKFANLAAAASTTEYIPESDAIIAHTQLIGGGESTSITFEAPAKGTYDYICSFPAHYALMKGKFIVQ